jgi:hypothetical protein
MAKKDNTTEEVEFIGMPGADAKTEEDVAPFQVDMNFEDEPETETTEAAVEEETEEEDPGEETTEEVAEEQVEEATTEEPESETETPEPEAVQGDDEQPVEAVEEGSEEVEEVEEVVEEPKAPMVPKSRLDEVLAKNKEMQKRLQDIEGKEAEETKAPEYDFVAQEKAYQDLVLEGETEKAALLRQEIRTAEREQLMSEMQSKMGQTVQQDRELHELNQKASEIMEVFPIFDEKSKSYDEALTSEVMELRDAFIYQGYGAADSLAKATEVTLLSKKPELLQGEEAPAADPAPKLTKAVQEKKQKATVKKKVAASQAQPPEMKGESTKNKKVVDINVMSDDEFGALPEDTLRRLRGDFD